MVEVYKSEFIAYLQSKVKLNEPKGLYDPIIYILNLGGKKLRPILTLMAADIFGGNYKKALDAALTVEVFHNFTLIHDDIMDAAPLRRGKETVHEKWDVNTGILSGDAMLILAYQYLENYDAVTFKKLMSLFSKTALEVCEGQQMDVDFETRNDVAIEEYIKMISLKTSVLVAAALKMGAVIAEASEKDLELIYDFGLNLGIAFQLQDDYLDAFGDPKTFGKQVGGDIIENKKTYLYIKALELGSDLEQEILIDLFNSDKIDCQQKIEKVKAVFNSSRASDATKEAIKNYTHKAFDVLDAISIPSEKKQVLIQFGKNLMNRNV